MILSSASKILFHEANLISMWRKRNDSNEGELPRLTRVSQNEKVQVEHVLLKTF